LKEGQSLPEDPSPNSVQKWVNEEYGEGWASQSGHLDLEKIVHDLKSSLPSDFLNPRPKDFVLPSIQDCPSYEDAVSQSKHLLVLSERISENGKYKEAGKKFVLRVLFKLRKERLEMLDMILNKEPTFPNGRPFKSVWAIDEDKAHCIVPPDDGFDAQHISRSIWKGMQRGVAEKDFARYIEQYVEKNILIIHTAILSDWEKKMGIVVPKTNQQEPIKTKRLRLTPAEREQLNDTIYDEVNSFIDMGRGSKTEAFKYCSDNSIRLFKKLVRNEPLTPKQIEGRYKRHPKD
jgi:hypothetical protein